MFWRKVVAFIKKDFFIQASYRLAFIFSSLSILASVATFYFISKLIGPRVNPYLLEYNSGYFPFVLVGIAFSGYFSTAMHSFSGNIRQEQVMGTLEAILMTPTKLPMIIIALSIWDFFSTSITTAIYLLFGVLFFQINLIQSNLPAAILILFLTIVTFSSFGILSASFVIIFKKGDPLSWLFSTFSGLLGGVFFPVSVMPQPLQAISKLLPITYSLRAMRQALLQGHSFRLLLPDIGILFLFCFLLLPISILLFQYSIRQAKITGSLTHY